MDSKTENYDLIIQDISYVVDELRSVFQDYDKYDFGTMAAIIVASQNDPRE